MTETPLGILYAQTLRKLPKASPMTARMNMSSGDVDIAKLTISHADYRSPSFMKGCEFLAMRFG